MKKFAAIAVLVIAVLSTGIGRAEALTTTRSGRTPAMTYTITTAHGRLTDDLTITVTCSSKSAYLAVSSLKLAAARMTNFRYSGRLPAVSVRNGNILQAFVPAVSSVNSQLAPYYLQSSFVCR